ncbi:hypothetical protein BDZ89DRAFT_1058503 [Hymenopellis radicata]|nr:hypothetical protein BDZ89DRAFT_1058503 [Hymenopellis radicata]
MSDPAPGQVLDEMDEPDDMALFTAWRGEVEQIVVGVRINMFTVTSSSIPYSALEGGQFTSGAARVTVNARMSGASVAARTSAGEGG